MWCLWRCFHIAQMYKKLGWWMSQWFYVDACTLEPGVLTLTVVSFSTCIGKPRVDACDPFVFFLSWAHLGHFNMTSCSQFPKMQNNSEKARERGTGAIIKWVESEYRYGSTSAWTPFFVLIRWGIDNVCKRLTWSLVKERIIHDKFLSNVVQDELCERASSLIERDLKEWESGIWLSRERTWVGQANCIYLLFLS